MKYNCGIIQDLLPLYIDGICSEDSRTIVQEHMSACENCKNCCEAMRMNEQKTRLNTQDLKLANGLANLKSRAGRRTRRMMACVIGAVTIIVLSFELLCVQSLKALGPGDISVTADVYAVNELPLQQVEDDETSVEIRKGADDTSDTFSMMIPSMPNAEIVLTENVLDETEYISVISFSSLYHVRDMRWRENEDENTIYVDSIKTSLLKNSSDAPHTQKMLQMRKIDKIVYLADDGSETVLWQAENEPAASEATPQ